MGDYYNATRGPLPITLNDGSPMSVGPKRWIFIPADKEGSSSIARLLDKGFLVKAKVPITTPKEEAKPAEAAVTPSETEEKAVEGSGSVLSPETPKLTPMPESKPIPASDASTSSMKEEFSKKKK